MRRFFVATAALAVSGTAWAQALDTGWRTYANARFGVTVEYPDVFSVRDPRPVDGDGQAFHTSRGEAKLTVYGSLNANQKSPGELMQDYKTAEVDYSMPIRLTQTPTRGSVRRHDGYGHSSA